MKKNIIFYSLFLCFISCKNKNEPEYFASNKIYNTIIESIDEIHNEISKTDSVFYIFNRYDTLIILSSERESILRPTYTIKKIGYFNYKKNKIIITQPYRPKFKLMTKTNSLNNINIDLKPPYYDGNDYPKGIMYKIKDLNHLELIAKGDLRKYFYPIKEYELIPPPPPKEYLGKPYKDK